MSASASSRVVAFALLGILPPPPPLVVLLWIGDREGETRSRMQMRSAGSKRIGGSSVPGAASHNPRDVFGGTIAYVWAGLETQNATTTILTTHSGVRRDEAPMLTRTMPTQLSTPTFYACICDGGHIPPSSFCATAHKTSSVHQQTAQVARPIFLCIRPRSI